MNKGNSLLEVTIAVGILATALMGATSLFNTSAVNNEYTNQRVLAFKACEEVMEEMKVRPFATLLTTYNNTAFAFLDVKSLPNQNIGLIQITDVGAVAGNLYEITVSITHPGPKPPPFSAKLVSRRAK
ncbi:MAG: hypothetical protein AAB019_10520 [Planctomycetota bacterium]